LANFSFDLKGCNFMTLDQITELISEGELGPFRTMLKFQLDHACFQFKMSTNFDVSNSVMSAVQCRHSNQLKTDNMLQIFDSTTEVSPPGKLRYADTLQVNWLSLSLLSVSLLD